MIERHPDFKQDLSTYSQHGEDIFIWNLFKSLGFDEFNYLDLGAHHPSIISNTKLFHDRGCIGVNVEANPYMFKMFEDQRPRDVNLNWGVDIISGEKEFYVYDDMSPCNTFSIVEKEKYILKHGNFGQDKRIVVPVRTINEIIDRYFKGIFGGLPNFINCDIEGLDFAVLNSAELSYRSFHTDVICVEVHGGGDVRKMTLMLNAKGFLPLVRFVSNVIYIHESHADFLINGLGIKMNTSFSC